MRRPLSWPDCTIPGCGHYLTHPDEDAMFAAVDRRDEWMSSTSGAVCSCHETDDQVRYGVATAFPCDQGAEVA